MAAASGAVLAASDAAVFDDGSTASDVRISGLRGRTETVGPALPQCARCDLCLTVLQQCWQRFWQLSVPASSSSRSVQRRPLYERSAAEAAAAAAGAAAAVTSAAAMPTAAATAPASGNAASSCAVMGQRHVSKFDTRTCELGDGYYYDSASMRLRFDRRSTPIRLQNK